MLRIIEKIFEGERAEFAKKDAYYTLCSFQNGESPLKHSQNIELKNCDFKYKYPLWYSKNLTLNDCILLEMARSGLWYSEKIFMQNCNIDAPKNFRRSKNINLINTSFANADETLWTCENIKLKNVLARGDYFAKDSKNIDAENLTIYGNYAFDGAKNLHIKNSKILSKDAFWNTKNLIIENCVINGEYLAWNSENLSFKNCVIQSSQALCYIKNLTLLDCETFGSTLAFEYSEVKATINGEISSIINPLSGEITAEKISQIILNDCDKTKIKIVQKGGENG
ncbi:MAG: DUF3737 family protein [Campylobacter sp.]|nr:DUF3737 family protein [Campylobacter sp.]